MSKTLMIVESPAKARTIGKLLGSGTTVLASMGHVSDLPQRELGVDLSNDFKPEYVLTANGRKVMKSLKDAAKNADTIYLATDPDREGEAIAWHLHNLLKGSTKAPFHRIAYHEITRSAIMNAFAHPGTVELPLVDAQQARRALDRLVGYQVSPLLWRSVEKDTSAGRVQSVALRLIVDREREIDAFKPVEYWNLDAVFSPKSSPKTHLKTRLNRLNGKKANVADGATAKALEDALKSDGGVHTVSAITSTPRVQHPAPPFTTSTMQQAAGSALRFGTSQTMSIAQQLYEGIDLGGTTSGLITYMRTDSVNVAKEAQDAALAYIKEAYGSDYVPATPNHYRSSKSAQEAHEAIRPTNVARTPDSIAAYLTPQQLKLYRLIWTRFVASQMASAKQIDHAIEIQSNGGALETLPFGGASGVVCTFRAAARETTFPGYLVVYSMKDLGQEDEMDNLTGSLPDLTQGVLCDLQDFKVEQCFTQPPNRYSEAALVKALEANGVGRPSTFASIVKTILDRKYVDKEKNSLRPTELGFKVNDFLVAQFPALFDVGFTAKMEGELDDIEEGKINWVTMLHEFYGKFQEWLAAGGARPTPASLTADAMKGMLECFDDDFKFDPPVAGARRVYNDATFVASLRKRFAESGEAPNERQAAAFMSMVARYADRCPALVAKANALGLSAQLQTQISANAAAAERRPNAPEQTAIEPEIQELLAAMKKLDFEAPVTRGKRVFDDAKFFRSLARQASTSKALSVPQRDALKKLAMKYVRKLPGLSEIAAKLGWNLNDAAADASGTAAATASENGANTAEAAKAPENAALCEKLLALVKQITTWNPPTMRGRRVFDDKKFAMSLVEQFENRGALSERQTDALVKTLARYSAQLPEGALDGLPTAETAATPAAAPAAPVLVDELCPLCGKPLKRIAFRGRTFLGCSGYPKCKFTKRG
ncbi:MAG: type I DNA topoisomerase [Lentisphaeria bacterium]|nr:type I DNA topoisomerase [Lentisphaeria bacterium]